MGDGIARSIGPRRVGGRYRSAYRGRDYEVLAIHVGPDVIGGWAITVQFDDRPHPVTHGTDWSTHDQVISQPVQETFEISGRARRMQP